MLILPSQSDPAKAGVGLALKTLLARLPELIAGYSGGELGQGVPSRLAAFALSHHTTAIKISTIKASPKAMAKRLPE